MLPGMSCTTVVRQTRVDALVGRGRWVVADLKLHFQKVLLHRKLLKSTSSCRNGNGENKGEQVLACLPTAQLLIAVTFK
jgi:hypothetical protein